MYYCEEGYSLLFTCNWCCSLPPFFISLLPWTFKSNNQSVFRLSFVVFYFYQYINFSTSTFLQYFDAFSNFRCFHSVFLHRFNLTRPLCWHRGLQQKYVGLPSKEVKSGLLLPQRTAVSSGKALLWPVNTCKHTFLIDNFIMWPLYFYCLPDYCPALIGRNSWFWMRDLGAITKSGHVSF